MKSLILKDLYNIGHNGKSMLFMLLIFGVVFLPQEQPESYIVICSLLCSMMIITTFSFDDQCKWMKYAMVMPISRRDLVAAKFVVLLIFSSAGALIGLVLRIIGIFLIQQTLPANMQEIFTLLGFTLTGFLMALLLGSISIPLLIKFGAEKARILSIFSFLVPIGLIVAIYKILTALGVTFSDQLLFILMCLSPAFVLLWVYLMYQISYGLFMNKELLHN